MIRSLAGKRIAVVSRCSRTLYTFRRSLIHRLQNEGAHVFAVGCGGDGYEKHLKFDGIEFRHVPVAQRSISPLRDVHLLRSLAKLFDETRPDVVHAFTVKPAIYATLAAALAKVPVRIVTITGLGHAFTTASPLIRRVAEWLYRLALARAGLVFFQNAEDRDLFVGRRLIDSRATALVPGSGVDLSRFSPVPLPCRKKGAATFLMIGRLLREKGVLEFVSAASSLNAQRPRAQIRLVGGVDDRNPSSLRSSEVDLIRCSRVVQWEGEVLDVKPHIEAADVLVLPSYREGLPRSLLEGAAMGRALIASDTPGCRDVVKDGENGYLVPPGDTSALARAMIRLADDADTIERFGRAARRLVEEHFDERVVIARTIEAYLALLSVGK
jgi:glycosyltransferase involved in cell wall biosynthesis